MSVVFTAASGALPARHRFQPVMRRFYREFGIAPARKVTVVVENDAGIRAWNRAYFKRNTRTDVISVTIDEEIDGEPVWGELYVSSQTARREAARRGIAWHDELLLYVVHGLLHLAGHVDTTAAGRRRMWRRQREFLAACGYDPDPPRDA
ncbi:MAG: rRNA maturation RNase YbeY [Planctomycetota bacterium]